MNLISVYSAAGKLEAEMIKGFLEAQEFTVILNQESLGRTMGLTAGGLGRVDVLIPENQAEEAMAALAAVAEGEFENSENSDLSNGLSESEE